MFQVQFVVDDKRFGDVMASLSGKVMNLEWRHLANTKLQNGTVVANATGGSIKDAILPALVKSHQEIGKGKQFTADMLTAKIEELGGSAGYKNGITHYLLKNKLIKRVAKGTYVMVKR